MINNNEFVDRYYPAANATRKDDVLRFLDNLNELIGDTPVKDALKNKSILCRVFYLQKSGNISRPHYQKIKEYLLNLFDYTGVEGIVPSREDVIAAQNAVCYFRSINALLAFIDFRGAELTCTQNQGEEECIFCRNLHFFVDILYCL